MDTRSGKVFGSLAQSIAAGARAEEVVPVDVELVGGQQVIRVKNGPFRGRVYALENGRRGRRLRAFEDGAK